MLFFDIILLDIIKGESVSMVKYIIPGFYEHTELNLRLIQLIKKRPEMFREGTAIHACYGNFQFCIFDGGRSFGGYKPASKEQIDKIAYDFNNLDVRLRLVFTNNQLKPTDYYDRFGNIVLDECENNFNEIVIADEKFEEHIRSLYPQYQYISSTTKCLTTPALLKEELAKQNYYMVCLDYNLNKNMKMLKELSPEEKGKCEFLINAICAPGCPNRKEHYRLNSLFSLDYGKHYQMEQCMIHATPLDTITLNSPNNFTPNDIYNVYAPMGFQYFKIEGRTWGDKELALTYAYYMVKPEYQYHFLEAILNNL